MTDIIVPTLGESISTAIVGRWLKSLGETVTRDEILVELETDKVSIEVPASSAGVLNEILADEGASVDIGAVLGRIDAQGAAASEPAPANQPASPAPAPTPSPAPAKNDDMPISPSVRRIAAETGIDLTRIQGSGPKGRITKADALAVTDLPKTPSSAPDQPPIPAIPAPPPPVQIEPDAPAALPVQLVPALGVEMREERVRMSPLRQTIARRMKDAQNTAAILTTFNDVDLSEIIALRKKYGEDFQARHGVKLGFMGFFTRACVAALKEIRAVNAEIDGNEIVYKHYYHIAIAVGTDKGLVTPVVRDADQLSLAEIEIEIARLAKMASQRQLSIDDLRGGSFTITNGGVYGSMLSTPILNPPQSGVLGMHKIEPRPVAVNGEIVIRPMMYLALSYDHRVVDGQGAVTFLVRVKQCLEDPERLLLGL